MSQNSSDSGKTKPLNHRTALQILARKQAMQKEFDALQNQNTWTLVPPPLDKNLVVWCGLR